MSMCGPYHRELTNGKGKCSVPMWDRGMPAGFCDTIAYGKPELMPKDRYIPGLACVAHGGPPRPPRPDAINIRFDGPPSHESGRFIEVENDAGTSISIGEWIEQGDGTWLLRILGSELEQ